MAKGLVYWYFENKETLFREIVADMGRRLRRAPAGRSTASTTRWAGCTWHRRVGAVHRREPPALRHHLHPLRGDRGLRDTRSALAPGAGRRRHRAAGRGPGAGQVRTDEDPAVLAHANAGVVYYFVLLYADGVTGDGRRRLDLEAAAHGAARYVVRAVAADDAAVEAVLDRHAPTAHAERN